MKKPFIQAAIKYLLNNKNAKVRELYDKPDLLNLHGFPPKFSHDSNYGRNDFKECDRTWKYLKMYHYENKEHTKNLFETWFIWLSDIKASPTDRLTKFNFRLIFINELYLELKKRDLVQSFDNLFDKCIKVLERPDFFISYTNDYSRTINRIHHNFIHDNKSCYSQDIVKRIHNGVMNGVPAALNQLLKELHLSGFYDKLSIKIGNDWKEKYLEASSKAFGFIQLLQPECFTDLESNHVYKEYISFVSGELSTSLKSLNIRETKDRFFFIHLTNNAMKHTQNTLGDRRPKMFKKWVDTIKAKNYYKLEDSENIIDFRDGVLMEWVSEINEIRKKVIRKIINEGKREIYLEISPTHNAEQIKKCIENCLNKNSSMVK